MAKTSPRGQLSEAFSEALTDGVYEPVIRCICNRKELDAQVRGNYLNIYYRGGNILELKPNSTKFDKFYFFDREKYGYPKSYVLHAANNEWDKIPEKSRESAPTHERAKEIIHELENEARAVKSLLTDNPERYFDEAERVMDNWFDRWHHGERSDQQTITTNNREFSDANDLVVIDIEFAVSTRQPYNKAVNRKGNSKVCRFDIIAVDRNGRLHVIELKENGQADSNDNPANVKVHKKDFDDTVGADSTHIFADEMKQVVETKKKLGLLPEDVTVDTALSPEFAVAFSGESAESFNEKYRACGIKVVEVSGPEKKLKL